MDSKITDTLSRKIPIIVSYFNGQKNIYKDALNRTDLNNMDAINEAIEKIHKQANYYPKNIKITTAVLIQEIE